jgi:putative chitinase
MTLDAHTLQRCLAYAQPSRIALFLKPLNDTLEKFEINNKQRVAAFLAQIAHESGCLKYVREIASGAAYEGRLDLGNTQEGDGVRFRGRGLIQITGRANYHDVGKALNYDFITHPEHLELPGAATMSAGWFWKKKGLNELADGGQFTLITRRINGGLNGWEDRVKHWNRCKEALGVITKPA